MQILQSIPLHFNLKGKLQAGSRKECVLEYDGRLEIRVDLASERALLKGQKMWTMGKRFLGSGYWIP
jgi:hypothetical protein